MALYVVYIACGYPVECFEYLFDIVLAHTDAFIGYIDRPEIFRVVRADAYFRFVRRIFVGVVQYVQEYIYHVHTVHSSLTGGCVERFAYRAVAVRYYQLYVFERLLQQRIQIRWLFVEIHLAAFQTRYTQHAFHL